MATDPNAPATPSVDPAAPAPDAPAAPIVAGDPAAPVGDPAAPAPAPTTPAEPAKPAVPEKYELALPKDSPLPVATLERTAAIARTLGLSTNEAAQQLVEFLNAEAIGVAKAQADAQTAAWEPGKGSEWKRQQTEWEQAALKDAEIGGTPEKLKASAEKAYQVVAKFFPPSVMAFLKDSGIGSNPDVMKGFAKLGRAMSEGTLALGAPAGDRPKTLEERMYPGGGEGPKKQVA